MDEKKFFTPWRITGALFAVIATIFVVSPQWHSTSFILLAILPFLAGLLAGWQPAGNAKVAEATGSMLVSITWNFIVGFCVLGAALAIRVASRQGMSASSCRTSGGCISAARWG